VSMVNELANIEPLSALTEKVLGRPTRIYALSLKEFERTRDLFVQYRNDGKLPEKEELIFFSKTIKKSKKEHDSLAKANDLFDGNLGTIEGDEH
jgi:hypothetical protein